MNNRKEYKAIGKSVDRVDAFDKATGQARYGADYSLNGQLFGHVKYTDHPHAEIITIHTEKARSLSGVRAVLTHDDIPGKKSFGSVVPHQMVLCSDKVRYTGDVVAIVAAETLEIAEKACELITIDYKTLPIVDDPKTALTVDSPLVYPDGNLCRRHKVRKGDISEGFSQSDEIIERIYTTSKIEHAYIEPEAVLAEPGENGGITIIGSVQNLYTIRRAVAGVLGLPLNKVRIKQATLGGSFGGKDEAMGALCCRAAILALFSGKPVKMVNSRENSMRESYKRHPYRMEYKIGAKVNGKLQAIEVKMYADAGAYAAMSPFVTWRSVVHATGPYVVTNVQTDVYAAYTNNCYTGAMRGFGSPQVCFAIESLMDELAEKLGLDPLEFRMINILKDGSTTATGQILNHKVGLEQAIQNVTNKAGFKNKWQANRAIKSSGSIKSGIGIACSYRGISLGAEGTDAAGVVISIQTDGSVIVSTGLVDMGQGAGTTISLIVAEELGISIDKIRFLNADTSLVPDSGPTVASRTTFMAGNAARKGCSKLLERLNPIAANILNCSEPSLVFKDNHIINEKSDNKLAFADLTEACFRQGVSLITHGWYKSPVTSWDEETGQGDAYFTYVYGANLAEVEVDTKTGRVKVRNFVSSHDLGRVINRGGAKGQIYGGVAMGLGYALFESYTEEEGLPRLENFDEYLLPTSCDIPPVDIVFVENPDALGPYGAKSLGEPACEIAAPAIANAIANATGMRVRKLPLTLERVLLGKNLHRNDVRGSAKAQGENK
ncbi:MAG: xanthine dehydrogenase family protein [candidate division Zixibacteria bacterium]|nr:xanthine dehydrogenase family protein [candidate division Zixibacteria bacterium]